MAKITALKVLAEKIEAGTLSNRRIDAEVDAIFRIGSDRVRKGAPWAYKNFPIWRAKENKSGWCEVAHSSGEGGLHWESLKFSTSRDAAHALHIDVLGDRWGIRIWFPNPPDLASVELERAPHVDKLAVGKNIVSVIRKPEARARLLATIKAKIQELEH